jgi:hypothetical protein
LSSLIVDVAAAVGTDRVAAAAVVACTKMRNKFNAPDKARALPTKEIRLEKAET